MELRIDRQSARRLLGIGAAVAAVAVFATRVPSALAFLSARLADVIVLLVVSITLTYIVKPIVDRLAQLDGGSHRGRIWATLLVFLCLGISGWFAMRFTVRALAGDWKKIEPFLERERRKEIQLWVKGRTDSLLQLYEEKLPPKLKESIENNLAGSAENMLESLSKVTERFAHWLRLLVELIAVPVLTFYFLTDGKHLREELNLLLPRRFEQNATRFIDQADRVLDGYVRGQLILCGIALLVTTAAAVSLQLPYALSLGLWGGITRAIPFVGPIFGGLPLIAVAGFSHGTSHAVVALVITSCMHFIESKFIMPKVIGHEVGLHPVTIIVSLLIAYQFFGIIGMFLAAPLIAILKMVVVDMRERKVLDLREGEAPAEPAVIERVAA